MCVCVISTQDELDENSKCVYEKLIFDDDDDEEEVKTKNKLTHTHTHTDTLTQKAHIRLMQFVCSFIQQRFDVCGKRRGDDDGVGGNSSSTTKKEVAT